MSGVTPPTAEQLANRKEWVAALRSGKYEQGAGALNADGRFCCLGVACDIFGPRLGLEWGPAELEGVLAMEGQGAYLPIAVAAELGINTDGRLTVPVFTFAQDGEEEETSSLAGLNDDTYYAFAQIADVVEEQFIAPFEQVPA